MSTICRLCVDYVSSKWLSTLRQLESEHKLHERPPLALTINDASALSEQPNEAQEGNLVNRAGTMARQHWSRQQAPSGVKYMFIECCLNTATGHLAK